MTYVAEQLSLETWWDARWSLTSTSYDNVAFDPSDLDEWVRFDNLPDDAKQASMGSGVQYYRHFGIISIQIFVLPNSGATRAILLAETACGFLRSAKIDEVTMFAPFVRKVGVADGWYQLNVMCNYYRDSLFSRAV